MNKCKRYYPIIDTTIIIQNKFIFGLSINMFIFVKSLLRFRGLAFADKEDGELSNWFSDALPENILEMGREAEGKAFEENAMESLAV